METSFIDSFTRWGLRGMILHIMRGFTIVVVISACLVMGSTGWDGVDDPTHPGGTGLKAKVQDFVKEGGGESAQGRSRKAWSHAGAKFASDGPDVAILHPPDGAHIPHSDEGFVLAAYISSFCVSRLGSSLKGMRLVVNGMVAAEQPLMVHGNDGSAQYHISMAGMPVGDYHVEATAIVEAEGDGEGEGEVVEVEGAIIDVRVVAGEKTTREGEGEGEGSEGQVFSCWGRTENELPGGRFAGCNGLQGLVPDVADESRSRGEVCDVSCDSDGSSCCSRCSGHGRCMRGGGCLCTGDWFGDGCALNAMSASKYTPPASIRVDSEGPGDGIDACASTRRWLAATTALYREIEGEGGACGGGENVEVKVSLQGKAMGAQMHFLALGLSSAVSTGRRLVFDQEGWRYGRHGMCGGEGGGGLGWGCYFAEWGREGICSGRDVGDVFGAAGDAGVGAIAAVELKEGLFPPLRWESMGLLWWRSSLLGALLEPSKSALIKLREAMSAIGWQAASAKGKIVGVHVRRGDSCLHADMSGSRPTCLPARLYVEGLRALNQSLEIGSIFLATDDQGVVEEMEEALAPMGVGVLSLPFDRGIFSAPLFIEHRVEGGYVDTATVAEASMLDLMLLARCDGLVVGLASQLARLAFSLMANRLGGVPPFVSVDGYSWGRHAQEEMHEVMSELKNV